MGWYTDARNAQANERTEQTELWNSAATATPSSPTLGHMIEEWSGFQKETLTVCGREMKVEIDMSRHFGSRSFPFTVEDVLESLKRVLTGYEHVFDESMFPDVLYVNMKDQPTFKSGRDAYGEFHKAQSKKRARTGSMVTISLYTMNNKPRKTKNEQGRRVTWYTNDGERITPITARAWGAYLDSLIAHELAHGFDFFIRGKRPAHTFTALGQPIRSQFDAIWPDSKAEAIANSCARLIGETPVFPWGGGRGFSGGGEVSLHKTWDEIAGAYGMRVWKRR